MRSLATLQKCTRAKNEPHLFFCFVVVVASTMKLAEVLLVILIPASFAQHHDFIKVDTPSKQFIDSTGRARLFHGVNVVYKSFPYHPSNGTFDPQLSFNQQDIDFLVENGFTIVRLYVAWQGVEYSKGHYNSTYLKVLENTVNMLGKSGIYTILDCHQDVWSPKFCGEGAPDYAALYQNRSKKPLPFPRPIPSPFIPYKTDPRTGYPYRSECNKNSFFMYYFTDAVGKSMQSLYDNEQQIQDQFAKFWAEVADYFSSNPYVFGYELLNEPWAGDVYGHPDHLLSHVADSKNLMPMYKKLHSAIREQDDNHIILFEPTIILTSLPLKKYASTGLTEGPGGPSYNDRQVFSYHLYCILLDSDGQPKNNLFCDANDKEVMEIRIADSNKMGVAGFLTEWGAYSNATTPGSHPFKDGVEIVNLADEHLQSWTYWQFKGFGDFTTQSSVAEGLWFTNGTVQTSKLKLLSRTYAPMVAGKFVSQAFDDESGDFSLTFSASLSLAQVNISSMIYLNDKLYYPKGYTVSITPSGSAEYTSRHNQVEVIANSKEIQDGQNITVKIAVK